jgi:hypothetical protein
MSLCSVLGLVDALLPYTSGNLSLGEIVYHALHTRAGLPDFVVILVECAGVLLVVLLTTWVVRKPLEMLFGWLTRRKWVTPALLAVAVTLWVLRLGTGLISPISPEVMTSMTLLILSVVAFAAYEEIDYERYMLIHLKKYAKTIGLLWGRYFLSSRSGLTLGAVVQTTVALASGDASRARIDLSEYGRDSE